MGKSIIIAFLVHLLTVSFLRNIQLIFLLLFLPSAQQWQFYQNGASQENQSFAARGGGLDLGPGGGGKTMALSTKSSKLGLKERGQPAALQTRPKEKNEKPNRYQQQLHNMIDIDTAVKSQQVTKKETAMHRKINHNAELLQSSFQPSIMRYTEKQEIMIHIQGKRQKRDIKLHVVQFYLHGISR